jgi:hypothetical protein
MLVDTVPDAGYRTSAPGATLDTPVDTCQAALRAPCMRAREGATAWSHPHAPPTSALGGEEWRAALAPFRVTLTTHRLYRLVTSIEDVRVFMEHHVFAVWDFMSLLKALQRLLTSVSLPWLPHGDPAARRLVNTIVLGEESDEDGAGGYLSHFEMYLAAMEEAEADTVPIRRFVDEVRAGRSVGRAVGLAGAPAAARDFVRHTWAIASCGKAHRIAAAFTLGREEIIPQMFVGLIAELRKRLPGTLGRFHAYLERHVELDGNEHAPMGLSMLEGLCGDDVAKRVEAHRVAKAVLTARCLLWDGIANQLDELHAGT